MKFALALLKTAVLCSVICISVFGQDPATVSVTEITEAYLAKSDENGKAGEARTIFDHADIPIFCVVRLNVAETKNIRMELIAVGVAGVKSGTSVVSTTYTLGEHEDRVSFTGRPHGKWVAGKYRADIYIGTKLEKSLPFEIVQPAAKPVPASSFVKRTGKRPAPARSRRN